MDSEERQLIRQWLQGRRVQDCQGCPRKDILALDREDQEVLVYKYGLVQMGRAIGYPVEDIVRTNDSVGRRFGINSRQGSHRRVAVAMRRLMWRRNGTRLPEVLASFMHSAPEGADEEPSG
ncbi:MAG TPA: hypothetical protein VGH44_04305 [Candidatus Saccharimonadia bacterium]|jgi:hypothetical protein